MVKVGFLVKLVAKEDQVESVRAFLEDALPLAQDEAETIAWFAVRHDERTFYIFDVFPDEQGRKAHFEGRIADLLKARWSSLLSQPPSVRELDVVVAKMPGLD